MGPLTYGEAGTLAIMTFAIAFWVAGGYIKAMPQLSTTAVALMALALMLMSGVLTWEGCLGCTFAWGESSLPGLSQICLG
jgi:di/tricarboxylate transporter